MNLENFKGRLFSVTKILILSTTMIFVACAPRRAKASPFPPQQGESAPAMELNRPRSSRAITWKPNSRLSDFPPESQGQVTKMKEQFEARQARFGGVQENRVETGSSISPVKGTASLKRQRPDPPWFGRNTF